MIVPSDRATRERGVPGCRGDGVWKATEVTDGSGTVLGADSGACRAVIPFQSPIPEHGDHLGVSE